MKKNCIAVLMGMFVIVISHAATFTYTAITENTIAKPGQVKAMGILWQCRSTRCVTRGPWPKPGIGACAALAKQVKSKIKSYGHPKGKLSAKQLAQCNRGLATALGKKPSALTRYPSLRTLRPGSVMVQPKKSGAAPPFSFRSDALVVTGTGVLATRGAFSPKRFRADGLSVTGTGALR